MDRKASEELSAALRAIVSMTERSEKAKIKFSVGTSQHTLQVNRINALNIAFALVKNEAEGEKAVYTKAELEKAVAPIESLLGKSQKARQKLKQGSWQYVMLSENIAALDIALPLIKKELELKN